MGNRQRLRSDQSTRQRGQRRLPDRRFRSGTVMALEYGSLVVASIFPVRKDPRRHLLERGDGCHGALDDADRLNLRTQRSTSNRPRCRASWIPGQGRAWRPRRAVTGLVAGTDPDEANGKTRGISPIKHPPFHSPSAYFATHFKDVLQDPSVITNT